MQLSFRDPHGQLLQSDNRILRFVNSGGINQLSNFLSSDAARRLTVDGCLVKTEIVDEAEVSDFLEKNKPDNFQYQHSAVVEHERISFPNFPYEWSPEMLFAAAELTLDLAGEISGEGFGLKDATPDNILFRGAQPVFVDLLSFEPRDRHDPTWLPYAQFVRTFLLPLLANKYFSLPLNQIFLPNRDGLQPEVVYQMCGFRQKFKPPFLSLVTIPKLLENRKSNAALYEAKKFADAERSQFVLSGLFKRLRRQLNKVKPSENLNSEWSNYANDSKLESYDYFWEKCSFVANVLSECCSEKVLDIGCNTGEFSEIAARSNAEVVGIDSDAQVINRLWRKAKNKSLKILPLVVDIARPSPKIGWHNDENASFIERAGGYFDTVLMLAVVHHLLVTERIPLAEILRLAAELTGKNLVIEFVAPDDEMFRQIARGRDSLFRELTAEFFEKVCREHFNIVRVQPTPRPTRRLYHLRKKVEK